MSTVLSRALQRVDKKKVHAWNEETYNKAQERLNADKNKKKVEALVETAKTVWKKLQPLEDQITLINSRLEKLGYYYDHHSGHVVLTDAIEY